MVNPAPPNPFILVIRNSVANTYVKTVPSAPCIGNVEKVGKVGVKIRFTDDSKIAVIVCFPKVFPVIFASRRTVHANRLHGIILPEMLQPFREMLHRTFRIPFANGHVFIMIANFMSKPGYLSDDFGLIALLDYTEIIGAPNA